MIDDFTPAKQPAKSLQTALDQREPPATKTDSTGFRTPEEVAAEQDLAAASQDSQSLAPADKQSIAHATRRRWHISWPPNKWGWLAIGLVVLLIAGGAGWWLSQRHTAPVAVKQPVLAVKKAVPPVPTTVPSALTGLPVDPKVNSLPVTGVMIENSVDARPQSGLSQAGVVFEAIAEGGITRFLALFQDTAPDNVGPIRSARPYYEQWALGFDAGYAHVGGSPEALADIKSWGVRDLDQFYNGGFYHRISSRAAPHNVYTGIVTLQQLEAKKGYTSSNFTGFPRKPAAPAKVPTARTINLHLSGSVYDVQYTYDAASNSYKRSEGGAPHIDANTNTQISPQVVVALVMPYSLEADGYHSSYSTIGSGPVYVFQDGLVTTGQWAKSGNSAQFVFTDSSGKPLAFNPGQTWLTAVGSSSYVSYAP